MTRSELVDEVHACHGGLSRREAQEIVDIILDLIARRLAAGERVDVSGFGSLSVVASAAREGRHPVTGRRFRVAPAKHLQFRPSRQLREKVEGSLREKVNGSLHDQVDGSLLAAALREDVA